MSLEEVYMHAHNSICVISLISCVSAHLCALHYLNRVSIKRTCSLAPDWITQLIPAFAPSLLLLSFIFHWYVCFSEVSIRYSLKV